LIVPGNTTAESKNIVVRNSRFEGPGKAGMRCEGSLVDVEIIGNRFFRLDAGVVLTRIPEGRPYKALVSQNTICEAKVGVKFPGNPGGKMDVMASRNYFVRTQAIVDAPGLVGLAAIENAHSESGPGNGPLPSQQLDQPKLSPPNPDDDATFLRFPGAAAPVINGNRVGAN
jgi:hypothetical protein